LQDIIVRRGGCRDTTRSAAPATDHAGIATQNAVEKESRQRGQDRHQLGRDAFDDKSGMRETYGDRNPESVGGASVRAVIEPRAIHADPDSRERSPKVFVDSLQQGK